MKFGWWRALPGPKLTIEGRRLDAEAPPLRASIPDGYGAQFQATGIIFPTPGCWEVTGRAGGASLTFVTRVVHIHCGASAWTALQFHSMNAGIVEFRTCGWQGVANLVYLIG
jgi:hypothetical protein